MVGASSVRGIAIFDIGKWVECCRVMTLPLLWVFIPLDVVELYILRATSEVCWVSSSAIGTFWGGRRELAGFEQSFEACC
jgi:hypothetical protein